MNGGVSITCDYGNFTFQKNKTYCTVQMTTWNLSILGPSDNEFCILLPYKLRFTRGGYFNFQHINDLPIEKYCITLMNDSYRSYMIFGKNYETHGHRAMSGNEVSNLGQTYQFTITYAHNNVEQSGVIANRFPI